jgi:hypothetical protein
MNESGMMLRTPSVTRRIQNWLARTPESRLLALRSRLQALFGSLYRLGLSKSRVLYSAYQPDSYYLSGAHAEFDGLFRRFTAHNRLNNGGDIPRLWALILNCKQIIEETVPGDFAELGVWRGNTAAVLAHYAHESGRRMFLLDTFEGFDRRDLHGIDADKISAFQNTSIPLVQQVVGKTLSNCIYVRGRFPESTSDELRQAQFALVSLDCDLYEPMKAGLEFFYPRMPKGGMLLLHDYSSLRWNGAKKAVDEFCARVGEFAVLLPDKSGSAFLRKTGR